MLGTEWIFPQGWQCYSCVSHSVPVTVCWHVAISAIDDDLRWVSCIKLVVLFPCGCKRKKKKKTLQQFWMIKNIHATTDRPLFRSHHCHFPPVICFHLTSTLFVLLCFVLSCISTSKSLLIILPANHPGWLWEVSIMFNGFNLVHYQSLRWALSVNHPNSIKMFYFCFLCSSLSIFPLQLLRKETQNVLYSKAFQSLQRNNPSLSYWFLIMFSFFD